MILTREMEVHVLLSSLIAPMVKRISRNASDVEFWVRFLVGAQKYGIFMRPEAGLGGLHPGIENLASISCDMREAKYPHGVLRL